MKFGFQEYKMIHQKETQNGFCSKWPNISKEGTNSRDLFWYIKCLKVAQNSTYVVVLFVLNLLLFLQIYRCFDLFNRGHTYIETKVVPQTEVLFPSITICPGHPGYKDEVLQVGSINMDLAINCFTMEIWILPSLVYT